MSGPPDPKSRSLARGERRHHRKVASAKQWQRLIAAKLGPCRVCMTPRLNGGAYARLPYPITFHHLVPRSLGGDDVEDNLVPLCGDGTRGCHGRVEVLDPAALLQLAASLTEAEAAYCEAKLGPGAIERLFGCGCDYEIVEDGSVQRIRWFHEPACRCADDSPDWSDVEGLATDGTPQ